MILSIFCFLFCLIGIIKGCHPQNGDTRDGLPTPNSDATGCRNTCTARGPRFLQFKFNNLFNEHFLTVFFFSKVFTRVKNWQSGDELLLKMTQQMVELTNHVIARAGFTLHGAPGALKIFATSFCQI